MFYENLKQGFDVLDKYRISLVAGFSRLPPGAANIESLQAAIAADVENVRLPGLPDDLNPLVMDIRRVEVFIIGLPKQSEETLRKLEGRNLILAYEGLELSAASVFDPETFANGYQLIVPEGQEVMVLAEVRARPRLAFVQGWIKYARKELSRIEQEVAELERHPVEPGRLTNAKWRRFAVAKTWQQATRALVRQVPDEAAMLTEATQAVERYLMPPWVGMPKI